VSRFAARALPPDRDRTGIRGVGRRARSAALQCRARRADIDEIVVESRAPEPRLTRRFAIYAALALIVAGAGIFSYVRSASIDRAEDAALFHTRFVADSILRDHLRPSDFQGPVTGRRLAELDALVHGEVLTRGALRAKLYDRVGTVTYSSDHTLIGKRPPDPEDIRHAFDGHLVSDVSRLNAEGGTGRDRKVLEAYVPVRGVSGRAMGVFELYQNYATIATAARDEFLPLAGLVALVLLVLYASFFPILRRATTRLRQQMQQIEHQAFHDDLTQLPNRALFRDRLEQALRSARRRGERVAVMLVDLDHFKDINDTLGHRSGDELLREVGANLVAALRASDTVARLGGDEFGVLAPAVSGRDAAMALADKVRGAVQRPHVVAGLELEVDAGIGVALFPDHGADVDALLRHADVAMYMSKERHAPAVYVASQDHYSPTRLALMTQLRRAIANRELVVHYQPQARLDTGAIDRVEALVRWEHPEHGLLAPDAFVPLAQHIGLIRHLTHYVLDAALCQTRQWLDDGLDLGVAVNITGRDLLDVRLPQEVAGLLARWGVEPSRLELEITEDTVLTDPVRAREILVRLSDLGVKLAIDDFGSGNSSLGYLKRLPVDVLKIDRSFVMNMHADTDDAVIVRSTIELGHNLGLQVVAEGVEDRRAWERLAELGCDVVQGYFLTRPCPADAVTRLMRESGGRVDALITAQA
jgi:diguanylate cyclase (GGDEF)-like protein